MLFEIYKFYDIDILRDNLGCKDIGSENPSFWQRLSSMDYPWKIFKGTKDRITSKTPFVHWHTRFPSAPFKPFNKTDVSFLYVYQARIKKYKMAGGVGEGL